MTRRLSIVVGLMLCASAARGDDCTGSPMTEEKFTPLNLGAVSLGPATHFDITPSLHAAYFIAGGKLYAMNAETGATLWTNVSGANCSGCSSGIACCQPFSPSSSVQRATIPVMLSDGSGPFVFISNQDGFLYKIDASNSLTGGNIVASFDARRTVSGTLCTKDGLKATPLIQMSQFSSTKYTMAYGNHDLVIVGTAYDTTSGNPTCTTGGRTTNKILAIDANTMALKWSYATFAHDEYDEGCDIDYQNGGAAGTDIIYCASKVNGTQRTLVALETNNSGASGNKFKNDVTAGDVIVRPFIRGNTVYVATTADEVKEYTTATGGTAGLALNWTCPLLNCGLGGAPCSITKNFWAEFRNGLTSSIMVVTTDGKLHKVLDTSDAPGGGIDHDQMAYSDPVVTEPAVDPSSTRNKVYVGLSDGRLHQISIVDLADEAAIQLSGLGPNLLMGDPAVDAVNGSATVNRVTIGNANGRVGRYCVPFEPGTVAIKPQPNGENEPKPYSEMPPVEPVLSGQPCQTDNDCITFYNRNQIPFNNACAMPRCETATGICFFNITPTRSTSCVGPNCTGQFGDGLCWDGTCFPPNPSSCGCSALNQQCTTATGNIGSCCTNPLTGGLQCNSGLNTDPSNCGRCGRACTGGQVCIGGVCCNSCSTTACVDTTSDVSHCGANCTACGPTSNACCASTCVNTVTDTSNCGGCGNQCSTGGAGTPGLGQTCQNGLCCKVCVAGGACVDNARDPRRCGFACTDCVGTGAGNNCCAGSCKNTNTDINNCGHCGFVCSNGNDGCVNGQCRCGTGPGCTSPKTCQSGVCR